MSLPASLLLSSVLIFTVCAPSAWAIGPAWQLPAGSVDALGVEHMWWFGRPTSLRTFDAPGSIADVAAALIAQVSPPPRLQAMPDGLLIVGIVGDVHWLLRLVAISATRTQGSASAISLQDAPTLSALAWQPTGMAIRLDLAARDEAAMVRQQILTDNGSAESTRKRLCAALPAYGWRADSTAGADPCGPAPLAWPVTGFWQRREATLSLVIDQQGAGSSVFVMQTDPLPSTPSSLWRKLAAGMDQYRPGGTR